ncbi:MAG: cellulase family glycosylhydrolase [Firmicutes bacterium]|nr:cellulase family glycosylhydrolase [Bacillota bacterium]
MTKKNPWSKLLYIILSISIFFSSNIVYAEQPLYGDIDGDKVITANDAAVFLNYLDKKIDFTSDQLVRANINGGIFDGNVAKMILNRVLDKNYKFNIPTTTETTTELTTREVTTETTTKESVEGKLSVNGTKLVDESGRTVTLKGYSTNGAWNTNFNNSYTMGKLKENGFDLFRLDMYVNTYEQNPDYAYNIAVNAIDAAKENGLYTAITWHFNYGDTTALPSYSQSKATAFFSKLSEKYGNDPYIIYEICSTQNRVDWSAIKNYADSIIPAIRANAPDALIAVGTPNWNQNIDEASALNYDNVMYTFQLSAATHKFNDYKYRVEAAKNKGLAVFVSQIKSTDDADNSNNFEEAKKWLDYFDENNISWCAFSLGAESENKKSYSFGSDTSSYSWTDSNLSSSGKFFFNRAKGITEIEEETYSQVESETEITTSAPVIENGVSHHGQLHVDKDKLCLVDENSEVTVLRGMSSHGLGFEDWKYAEYATLPSIKTTRENGANIFRVAMYTQSYNGYLTNDTARAIYKQKVYDAINAAISLDIYVLVDWHILDDGSPSHTTEESKAFFNEVSSKYANNPAVLYEICNEPNNSNWDNDIKPYAESVIPVIRNNSPNAIIIVGTNTWSQDVDEASRNKINDDNVMYTLHFYAGEHPLSNFKSKIETALANKAPIFVTEWGTTMASGNGGVFADNTYEWLNYLDEHNISWCNWSLSNKNESSAALKPSTETGNPNWSINDLSESGKLVFDYLKSNPGK